MESLVSQLSRTMKERNIKIPRLSTLLDIPKDRMYKWFQEGTNPKEEDAIKLRNWINGGKIENVPQRTTQQGHAGPVEITTDSLLKLIENNTILAKAHEMLAEANRALALSNSALVGKVTGGGFEGTHSNLDYKVGEILLVLADLATGKKYKSKEEAVAAFHKRIYGIQEKNVEVGTYEEGGK